VSYAERLREARIAKGMPQYEAAHRLGVALRTYIRWENRELKPRVAEFVAWCQLMGEDPTVVITLVEPEPAGEPVAS
jgi:transcriptional regulator with XRE-family HTH domain